MIKFNDDNIKEGKELLWKLRGGLLGDFTNRVRSVTRTAKEANIDDIISAISDLDASNKLPEFVAMDLDKLPGVQPEDLNIFYYIDRMASMETQLKQHTDEIISLKRHVSELKDDKQLHRDETNQQKEDIIKIIRDLSQVKEDYRQQLDEMKSLIHKQPDNQNSQKHINDKEEYKAKILNNGVGVVLTKVSNSALPGNSSSVSDTIDVESIPATNERLANEGERGW